MLIRYGPRNEFEEDVSEEELEAAGAIWDRVVTEATEAGQPV